MKMKIKATSIKIKAIDVLNGYGFATDFGYTKDGEWAPVKQITILYPWDSDQWKYEFDKIIDINSFTFLAIKYLGNSKSGYRGLWAYVVGRDIDKLLDAERILDRYKPRMEELLQGKQKRFEQYKGKSVHFSGLVTVNKLINELSKKPNAFVCVEDTNGNLSPITGVDKTEFKAIWKKGKFEPNNIIVVELVAGEIILEERMSPESKSSKIIGKLSKFEPTMYVVTPTYGTSYGSTPTMIKFIENTSIIVSSGESSFSMYEENE